MQDYKEVDYSSLSITQSSIDRDYLSRHHRLRDRRLRDQNFHSCGILTYFVSLVNISLLLVLLAFFLFLFQDNKVNLQQAPGSDPKNTLYQPEQCPVFKTTTTK